MANNEPIKKFQAGQVTCAVWENAMTVNGQPQTILKATVGRRFRDKDGQWKTSQSFSRNEIPLAIYVLQKAFEAMIEKRPEEEPAVDDQNVI
jgi:hypothetical protein